jgi:hypothetical protein
VERAGEARPKEGTPQAQFPKGDPRKGASSLGTLFNKGSFKHHEQTNPAGSAFEKTNHILVATSNFRKIIYMKSPVSKTKQLSVSGSEVLKLLLMLQITASYLVPVSKTRLWGAQSQKTTVSKFAVRALFLSKHHSNEWLQSGRGGGGDNGKI